jgi:4-methyl-5(b-hydroxyethyl)-thiazole monophosphate biosynthesis
MSSIAVILAEGFEDVEALTPVDFLRRAGIEVITVGLKGKSITSGHNVTVQADISLDEYAGNTDAILIPGGMPGAANIAAEPRIRKIVQTFDREKKLVAAICAAPALVLGGA